jgi:hypothetical protein
MHCSHLIGIQIRRGFHTSSYSVATECCSRLRKGDWDFSPSARVVLVLKLNNRCHFHHVFVARLWMKRSNSSTLLWLLALHTVQFVVSFCCIRYLFSCCFYPVLCLRRKYIGWPVSRGAFCMCGRRFVAGYTVYIRLQMVEIQGLQSCVTFVLFSSLFVCG